MSRAAVALALLAWTGAAWGHARGTSYSEWTLVPGGATVRVQVSQLELTRLRLDPALTPDYADTTARLLAARVQLWSKAGRCRPERATAAPRGDGWIEARWFVRCTGAEALTVRSILLHDVAPSHLHLARVNLAGEPPRERVLTSAQPAFELGTPADLAASLWRYVALGFEHILSGWDHLAFVLALVLAATRLGEVAILATGFTLAHSLTLGAAVLGVAAVRTDAVEALIGFSIVLVAAAHLWERGRHDPAVPWGFTLALAALGLLGVTQLPRTVLAGLAVFTACYFALARRTAAGGHGSLRVAVAFVFGLVHGFGFAGALAPLQLPPERLAVGLLGFNAGVELGQLLVIALAWPALRWLERRPPVRLWTGDLAAAGACALGTFWFVTRAFAT